MYAHAFGIATVRGEWRGKVRDDIPYYFGIDGQGECLPRYENYVALDPERKDAWGIPVLTSAPATAKTSRRWQRRCGSDLAEIIDAMKVEKASLPVQGSTSSARTSTNAARRAWEAIRRRAWWTNIGQVHDAKNVFVTDGAVFVTQGCYEPTLTIMALAARTADYIVEELKHGNL